MIVTTGFAPAVIFHLMAGVLIVLIKRMLVEMAVANPQVGDAPVWAEIVTIAAAESGEPPVAARAA